MPVKIVQLSPSDVAHIMQNAECVDHHFLYLMVVPATVHHTCGKMYEWFMLNTWFVFIIVHTDTKILWAFLKLFKMFLKSRSRNPEGQVKGLEGLIKLCRLFLVCKTKSQLNGRQGYALYQVMACCLTTPSCYKNLWFHRWSPLTGLFHWRFSKYQSLRSL